MISCLNCDIFIIDIDKLLGTFGFKYECRVEFLYNFSNIACMI